MTGRRHVGRAGALALACVLGGTTLAQVPSPDQPAPAVGKSCENAKKKVVREERASAEMADSLAKARRARETCVSRNACARYDETIRDTERQQGRQATRLARFAQERDAACGR